MLRCQKNIKLKSSYSQEVHRLNPALRVAAERKRSLQADTQQTLTNRQKEIKNGRL
jgi:hypothetical protein